MVLDDEEELVVRFRGRGVDVVAGEFRLLTDEEADVRLEWDAEVGDCGCDSAYPES